MTSDPKALQASAPNFKIIAEGEFGDEDELWAACVDVEGFFTNPGNPDGRRFIGLLDSSISGRLLECCVGRRSGHKLHSNAHLQVLDLTGVVIGSYFITVLGCYDCTRRNGGVTDTKSDGGTRYDATLDIMAPGKSPAVGEMWRRWSKNPPGLKNLWAPYTPDQRLAWLDVAQTHDRPGIHPDALPGTTFELDGKYVTDYAGLYCALGEAINGPGGYFGADLGALSDCLSGGFGATIPFKLLWHDFDVAADHLNKSLYEEYSVYGEALSGNSDIFEGEKSEPVPRAGSSKVPYLERVLEVLEGKQVRVVRA